MGTVSVPQKLVGHAVFSGKDYELSRIFRAEEDAYYFALVKMFYRDEHPRYILGKTWKDKYEHINTFDVLGDRVRNVFYVIGYYQ